MCPGEPCLSASPDGVLSSGELLGIKCPFLKANKTLEDLMGSHDKKYDVRPPWLLHTNSNWLVLYKAKGMQVTDLVPFKTGDASHPIWLSVQTGRTKSVVKVASCECLCERYMKLCK